MIYIYLPDDVIPKMEDVFKQSTNHSNYSMHYIHQLEHMKEWLLERGFRYVSNGSNLTELKRGTWCVQSFEVKDGKRVKIPSRRVCFHPDDANMAMVTKLTWA